MTRCASADSCLSDFLARHGDVNTAFDRIVEQEVKCQFGQLGVCCRLCSNGPCRVTPDAPKGVCGATADTMVARGLLRSVAAGAACYLHVAESTARRLKAIGEGVSPLTIRSKDSLDALAAKLGVAGKTWQDNARNVADAILADLYKPRGETMSLISRMALPQRVAVWEKTGLLSGGAKSEVFDALVKTSTNLNTDAVDQLLHCLRLGICTGLYGLQLTNLLNDVLMGQPTIRQAKVGFQVADPAYVNIAVTGHSHSVWAGLIEFLETPAGQQIGKSAGAAGVRIVGLTCVGQDMQLRASSAGDCYAGQAGNNFTQEALVATGAIDLVASEFNCTLSGIEPIAAKMLTPLVCLDDVAKQTSAAMLADVHGKEAALAEQVTRLAAAAYAKRRGQVKIDVPKHGYDDVVTGVSEQSLVALLGGTLDPVIDLIKAGTIKGVAGVLGCSNLAAGGHDVTTVALTRELIKRDILVLSAGCTTGGLCNTGFCSPSAAQWAGPGLRAVCEKLGIPPVLNFGPCLAIGRIEMVAHALAEAMGVDLPQLPVVISAPQWLEEQALADGCFGLALGLTLHLSQAPPILGSPLVTRVLTADLEGITGGRVIVEGDPVKAAAAMEGVIDAKLAALGLGVGA
ncbi:MAG: anaerobic carbon-monoxide dehydrogenase catalytic subunit [Planctomycetaceae bacterium]|nr:anaerobic carbon-monoxide dehydrogenase catalytic subunit [Planctomycetaceae bacterium]